MTQSIVSRDGTRIVFDRSGAGPAPVRVGGALTTRDVFAPLAQLEPHFTLYAYDRRGRGDSGDTPPYAVEREVEDVPAVIEATSGRAFVFGHSSGAALALQAAAAWSAWEAMAHTLAYDGAVLLIYTEGVNRC